ncbi:MAG TPA: ATP-binding protein [Oligoflexus sp.]|uniref:PAS domain-containing hybrid sensor histidine kinase/response regulator n=1 Tax=Oligoflexus sp. TaxID=1971216 RepID=UPI002D2883BF|nr:ATP-binding protein [Oligoflexus sp.]HYX35604.1 ATP-binding protein [Oligoflexus sp.]
MARFSIFVFITAVLAILIICSLTHWSTQFRMLQIKALKCLSENANRLRQGLERRELNSSDSSGNREDEAGRQRFDHRQLAELEAIYQIAPVGLAFLNHELRLVRMNEQMAVILGESGGMQLGRPLEECFPRLAATLGEKMKYQLETGEAMRNFEIAVSDPCNPGKTIYVLASLNPVADAQGHILGINAVLQDITSRKLIEENARAMAERFRCAGEIAAFLIYDWNTVTNTVIRLSGLADILGEDADVGVGKLEDWAKKIHPDDFEYTVAETTKAFESGAANYDVEYRVRDVHDNYTYIWDRGVIFRDDTGRVVSVIGVSVDIEVLKRLELELRQQAERLAEVDRRKDDFIAMLSHELRNPLTPIRVAVEILESLENEDEIHAQSLAMISRQVAHMSRLVDDLLDVSRISQGKITILKEKIDLTKIVRDASADYRNIAQTAGLSFKAALPQGPLWIEGDEIRLAQVISNILHNSIKFTQPGGTITLTLETIAASKKAAITVRDTGLGISADLLPHIFEMFSQGDQTIDRSYGGLGLGLALVKALVDKHDGSVQAMSGGLGQGTEIRILLPLGRFATAEAPRIKAPGWAKNLGLRILVIEDSPDIAESLRVFFSHVLDHEVQVAIDGVSGLEMARRCPPDIMLCDIGLPGEFNGYEVAKRFRALSDTGGTILVALTGYGTLDDQQKTRQAGFDVHLTKPPNFKELRRILDKAQSRKPRYPTDSIPIELEL